VSLVRRRQRGVTSTSKTSFEVMDLEAGVCAVPLESVASEEYTVSLRGLGLRASHFIEALGASNTERRICVAGHCAKSAPGYYAYNGMLTSLSAQMCGDEWRREDLLSMPLLLNRKLKVVLTVSSGDRITGLRLPGDGPRSKNPKGELTKELTRLNEITAAPDALFEVESTPLHKMLVELSRFTFWLTLVYFDKDEREIRCEVSQPLGLNARGQVNSYLRRIILPPYSLSDEDFPSGDDPNDGFGPINVDVHRR
jgi:hypothetical protein